jgi:hypothetical protein
MNRCPVVDAGTIGRTAVVVHQDRCYLAEVIDQVAGTHLPKRVRIRHDLYLEGRVLMPSQYQFKEWSDDD